jgi:hypothetical protein
VELLLSAGRGLEQSTTFAINIMEHVQACMLFAKQSWSLIILKNIVCDALQGPAGDFRKQFQESTTSSAVTASADCHCRKPAHSLQQLKSPYHISTVPSPTYTAVFWHASVSSLLATHASDFSAFFHQCVTLAGINLSCNTGLQTTLYLMSVRSLLGVQRRVTSLPHQLICTTQQQ